jgi:YesN/AraC family two-component response regulator
VIEAENGDEAAELLKSSKDVSLVLSDVRMPGELSGIDLARLVQRERPEIQVLLTTGYFDGEDTVEGLNLLYKPYRAADLAEKIRSLMEAPQPGNVDDMPPRSVAVA